MPNAPLAIQDRLTCRTCQRVFTRSEHLKRHELTHTQNRPFRCMQCGKDFFRKDALDRHLVTHQISGPNLVTKKTRACLNCASSKVRCSGESPTCSRCRKRRLGRCEYPSSSPSGKRGYQRTENTTEGGVAQVESSTANEPPRLSQPELATVLNIDQQTAPEMGSHVEDGLQPMLEPTINWLSDDGAVFFNDLDMDEIGSNLFFPMPDTFFSVAPHGTGVQYQQDHTPTIHPPLLYYDDQLSSRYASSSRSVMVGTPHYSATSSHEDHIDGEFYVDGQPARLPRIKRRRLTASTPVTHTDVLPATSFHFDVLDSQCDSLLVSVKLPEGTYRDMVEGFRRICLYSQSPSHPNLINESAVAAEPVFKVPFQTTFMSRKVLEYLLETYMGSFQPLLPIFHITSFPLLRWNLILVIASIGACLAESEAAHRLGASLVEFSRRWLYLAKGDGGLPPDSELEMAQFEVLHVIALNYASGLSSPRSQFSITKSLIKFCTTSWGANGRHEDPSDVNERWCQWKEDESRRRTGYAIWLVDCMLAVHYQQRTELSLQDASPQMPCCEELWNTMTGEEWQELYFKTLPLKSMTATLFDLYVKKDLAAETGEFSRILLIHGLFRRMREIESYYEDPLSQWMPVAHADRADADIMRSDLWLPSIPAFSKWRNSSCDCLDVLHWSANATIGKASGIEHPTVLHLHFARVVLLTPYKCIVDLALSLPKGHQASTQAESMLDQKTVRKWAIQDQYKARLAMIHAGVLFWHVRKYSSTAFYEPASVAIATLALWAFSSFSSRQRPNGDGDRTRATADQAHSDSEPDEGFCDIILLDRPTDDELVQQFVREGHRMKAKMNGVGDLFEDGAAYKVLIEGRRLLRSIGTWKSCETWIHTLNNLIDMSRHQGNQPP